jgi:hypothetical protein
MEAPGGQLNGRTRRNGCARRENRAIGEIRVERTFWYVEPGNGWGKGWQTVLYCHKNFRKKLFTGVSACIALEKILYYY